MNTTRQDFIDLTQLIKNYVSDTGIGRQRRAEFSKDADALEATHTEYRQKITAGRSGRWKLRHSRSRA